MSILEIIYPVQWLQTYNTVITTIDILYNKFLDTALPFISMAKTVTRYKHLAAANAKVMPTNQLLATISNFRFHAALILDSAREVVNHNLRLVVTR